MNAVHISNYDVAREQAQKLFLTYDITPLVKKYGLAQDSHFTYISFLGTPYRISKQTGRVDRLSGNMPTQANYNETMTIFDVLCYAKRDASLAGEFCSVMQLDGIAKTANPGGNMFSRCAELFTGRSDDLRRACEALNGIPYPVGEVAYQIPLFDFLPIVLQFWDGDEELDAQLIVKWDKNILHYMHFETTFYATGHLLQLLQASLVSGD